MYLPIYLVNYLNLLILCCFNPFFMVLLTQAGGCLLTPKSVATEGWMKKVTENQKSLCLLLIALSVQPPRSLALWPACLQAGWLTRISSALAKSRACLTTTARPTSVKEKTEKIGMNSLRLVLPCGQELILFPDPSCSEHPRGLSCHGFVWGGKNLASPQSPVAASSLLGRPFWQAGCGLYQVGKGFCSTSFKDRGTRALTPHSQAVNSLPAPPPPHSRS